MPHGAHATLHKWSAGPHPKWEFPFIAFSYENLVRMGMGSSKTRMGWKLKKHFRRSLHCGVVRLTDYKPKTVQWTVPSRPPYTVCLKLVLRSVKYVHNCKVFVWITNNYKMLNNLRDGTEMRLKKFDGKRSEKRERWEQEREYESMGGNGN